MDVEEHGSFDNIQVRPAHAVAKSGNGVATPDDRVQLHHPGYDDENESVLFTLPTRFMNNEGQPCAEYQVAWQGCYVVAINRPGFFTKKKERNSERVRRGQGLIAGHFTNPRFQYPVLPFLSTAKD